jgi:hemoglobin
MENHLPDITNEADIKRLVDTFYESINRDPLLAPIFNDHAKVNWAGHLPIMYRFWSSLLLGTTTYKGQPFTNHVPLPISREHFEQWITLFKQTVDSLFQGVKAEEAKLRAENIAHMFQYKLDWLKQHDMS